MFPFAPQGGLQKGNIPKMYNSLKQTSWECKYHVIFIPKYRKHAIYGQSFWARGYFVSTVVRDETIIREYIKKQSGEDKKLEQLDFFKYNN